MKRVVINKIESIERCVKRIEEIYREDMIEDFLYQDALILNMQRACQQSIDLAMYLCSKLALGIPKESKDSFYFLYKAKIIDEDLYKNMGKMVGFRNVVVHEYQNIDLKVVKFIAEKGKNQFLLYTRGILEYIKNNN